MLEVPLHLAPVRQPDPALSYLGPSWSASRLWTSEDIGALSPDAVVVDPEAHVVHILEYTRPSNSRPHALWAAASMKTYKYQILLLSLSQYVQEGWKVELHPLPVGVRSTLHTAHWVPMLESLGIPTSKWTLLLRQDAAASI